LSLHLLHIGLVYLSSHVLFNHLYYFISDSVTDNILFGLYLLPIAVLVYMLISLYNNVT